MESVASAARLVFQTWKVWGSFLARVDRRGDIQFGARPAEMNYKCELFPAPDKIPKHFSPWYSLTYLSGPFI
jgi:hypothetical protein